jgi:hypothetical protein
MYNGSTFLAVVTKVVVHKRGDAFCIIWLFDIMSNSSNSKFFQSLPASHVLK